MALKWSEIKAPINAIAPALSGSVLSDSQLQTMARIVNMRIIGRGHKFSHAIREYSLTLTGATEYNLASLIPDLDSVFQIYGDQASGREVGYRGQAQFNVQTGGQIFTITGNTLRFRNPPESGTLTIPYFSTYLVLNKDGTTRQKDFGNGDDTWVMPDSMEPVMFAGLLEFLQQKGSRKRRHIDRHRVYDGRIADVRTFDIELDNAIINDQPVSRSFHDFRILP